MFVRAAFRSFSSISMFSMSEESEDVQDIFPEAPLPLSLVEEVIEVAPKGDENKAKSQKPEYTC